MCETCWTPMRDGGLAVCDYCGLVWYCGEVCKAKDWDDHKLECFFIGQEGPGGRVLNDVLRLVGRIWLKMKHGGKSFKEKQGNLQVRWEELPDHSDELREKNDDFLTSQFHLLEAVMKKEGMPDMRTFITIYGRIVRNSFYLRSDTRYCKKESG